MYVSVSPSPMLGSDEPVPSSGTFASDSSTVSESPASATGGSLTSLFILMVTVSTAGSCSASVTVKLNTTSWPAYTVGVVNDGETVTAPASPSTDVPPVCTHRYVRRSGLSSMVSGSDAVALPSVTETPSPYGPYVPASAAGARFTSFTVTVTPDETDTVPSETDTLNVWMPSCSSVGVQVNTPSGAMDAPSGRVPLSENARVLAPLPLTRSASRAVAVNMSGISSSTSWAVSTSRVGALLTSFIVIWTSSVSVPPRPSETRTVTL